MAAHASPLPAMLLLLAGLLLAGCRSGNEPAAQREQALPATTASAAADAAQAGGLAAYDKNGDGLVYQDPMHPRYVQDQPGTAPDCGMKLTPVRVDGAAEAGTIRIDPVTIQNMGVRTTVVPVEPLRRTIRTTGRFVMNEQGEHTVSLKVGGWVEKLYADYKGTIVRKGQPLLELYSPKLVATQEEYLLALRNARRLENGPAADDAQRLLKAARRRLAYWDLTETQISHLEEAGAPQRTITFYAPASGEVMHLNVVEGQHIQPGQALMDIVDISTVWLIVDIYEQELPWIEIGTPARIELVSDPGKTYTGRVDYIYHMMEVETRTAKARIELPGGHLTPLKPGAYATVYLEGRQTKPAPVVPAEAVLRTGEREVVILALGDGRFRPVEVETGLQAKSRVQILDGLQGGEEVVTSAQFLIDSEARLKSALGAMASSTDEQTMDSSSVQQAESTLNVMPIDVRAADKNGDGYVYQGPMHPEEIRDAPGTCDVCGMKLHRVTVEEARQHLERPMRTP